MNPKTATMTAKTRLFQEVLGQLKQRAYFQTAAVAPLARQLGLKISDGTLRVYLSEAARQGLIHSAGRGWYSSLATEFKLNTKPTVPLVRRLKKSSRYSIFTAWPRRRLIPTCTFGRIMKGSRLEM